MSQLPGSTEAKAPAQRKISSYFARIPTPASQASSASSSNSQRAVPDVAAPPTPCNSVATAEERTSDRIVLVEQSQASQQLFSQQASQQGSLCGSQWGASQVFATQASQCSTISETSITNLLEDGSSSKSGGLTRYRAPEWYRTATGPMLPGRKELTAETPQAEKAALWRQWSAYHSNLDIAGDVVIITDEDESKEHQDGDAPEGEAEEDYEDDIGEDYGRPGPAGRVVDLSLPTLALHPPEALQPNTIAQTTLATFLDQDSAYAAGVGKYTPLEAQVVDLKRANPDVILMVEVAFKHRFFGPDAEVASKLLHIMCHPDRVFQTASIPSHRVHVHLQTLLEYGYKVAFAKQITAESASESSTATTGKKSSKSKGTATSSAKSYSRVLSKVYTRATYLDPISSSGHDEHEVLTASSKVILAVMEVTAIESFLTQRRFGRAEKPPSSGKIPIFAVMAIDLLRSEIAWDSFPEDDTVSYTSLVNRIKLITPTELILIGARPTLNSYLQPLLPQGCYEALLQRIGGVRPELWPLEAVGASEISATKRPELMPEAPLDLWINLRSPESVRVDAREQLAKLSSSCTSSAASSPGSRSSVSAFSQSQDVNEAAIDAGTSTLVEGISSALTPSGNVTQTLRSFASELSSVLFRKLTVVHQQQSSGSTRDGSKSEDVGNVIEDLGAKRKLVDNIDSTLVKRIQQDASVEPQVDGSAEMQHTQVLALADIAGSISHRAFLLLTSLPAPVQILFCMLLSRLQRVQLVSVAVDIFIGESLDPKDWRANVKRFYPAPTSAAATPIPESCLSSAGMTFTAATLEHLELLCVDGRRREGEPGSLLGHLNQCKTPMGSRRMREWIRNPLLSISAIRARQEMVASLCDPRDAHHSVLEEHVQGAVKGVPDIDRACARLNAQLFKPLELLHLTSEIIKILPHLIALQDLALRDANVPHLLRSLTNASMLDGIRKFISSVQQSVRSPQSDGVQILAAPVRKFNPFQRFRPVAASAASGDEGDNPTELPLWDFLQSPQEFPKVNALKAKLVEVDRDLRALLPKISQELGIQISTYTNVHNQDYQIEVKKSFLTPGTRASQITKNWVSLSSTQKVERFRPPEVQALVNTRDEVKIQLENESQREWCSYLTRLGALYLPLLKQLASTIADLDCLYALAAVSRAPGYTRPVFVDPSSSSGRNMMHFENLRHATLEPFLSTPFVPNTLSMGTPDDPKSNGDICIITGPNMGGKSTLLRSAALAIVLAQIGCYVPASSATLTVFDSIFTRMGAKDSIMAGKSTFFTELTEASHILRNATSRSLIILDELGRGTSTYDGVAVAYATLKYIQSDIRALTLFVTHYPAISALEYEDPDREGERVNPAGSSASMRICNYHMGYTHQPVTALDGEPQILFLYQLKRGTCPYSFGLNVAKLAGVPNEVVTKAASVAQAMQVAESRRLRASLMERLREVRDLLIHYREKDGSGESVEMQAELNRCQQTIRTLLRLIAYI